MTTPRSDSHIGTDLGPYHIEAVIGRGGMGVVYLATHTGLERRVALKLLTPDYADDEAFRARFLRESKLAASIDHPNIIPIYDAGEVEGTYYLAMRYVEGTDLQQRLRAGPLEPRQAAAVLTQVASALDTAHRAGLVHRDVKPANILIAPGQGSEGADHTYLTDFGLTKQRGSQTELTRMGGFMGTLDYIAPEQIEGRATDGRADQYALAAVAVAALSGAPPFPRDSDVATINAHLHDPPPALHARQPELPIAVDAVVARGLAKAPEDRYPDSKSFVDDLRDALGVTTTSVRTIPPSPGRWDRRVQLIVVGIAVLAFIALAALVATRGSPGPSSTAPASLGAGSPSPSSAGSPAEDPFPSAAEAALLRLLPADMQATCQRGSYNSIFGQAGGSMPIASLDCPPPAGAGATALLIRRFPQHGVQSAYVGGFISSIADGGGGFPGALSGDGRDVPPGDCATSKRANGRWTRAGQEVGGIICYTQASTGDAFLWWGYDDEQILVRASNQRGESDELYDWFRTVSTFMAP
jgi:serine/threonine-protein kinase